MGNKEINEYIQKWADYTGEPLITYDGLEDAAMGIVTVHTQPTRVVYSFSKIIEVLMRDSEMNYEEAIEYFDFNINGAWVGERTPAIFYDGT